MRLIEPSETVQDDQPDDTKAYKAHVNGKLPPRLRFKPGWRTHGRSIQWYPTPIIDDDLDRETPAVPQVITIIAGASVIMIEGFYLEKLADGSHPPDRAEIPAYSPRRWPGWKFERGDPKVTATTYEVLDGRTRVGKAARAALIPIAQDVDAGVLDDRGEGR